MSMKSMNALLAMSMIGLMSGSAYGSDRPTPKKKLSFNERKKCFRKGCNSHRTDNSLYCSNECQEKYHQELKDKETKSKLRI